MIYLIADNERKTCKIGYSNKPLKRFAELRVGNAGNLILASVIPGDMVYEKELHKKFEDYSRKGEWFYYSDEIKSFFNCWDGVSVFGYKVCPKFTETLMSLTSVSDFKLLIYILRYSTENEAKLSFRYADLQGAEKELNVGYRTIQMSFANLIDKGFILKPVRGEYLTNPQMLFRGDNYNRICCLIEFYEKNFITDEAKENKFISHNPLDKKENGIP